LKYLDGAIDSVEVLDADGKWTKVQKGGIVKVVRNKPVTGRVTLTNLGEATWLAKGEGAVVLRAARDRALPHSAPPRASVVVDGVVLAEAVNEATEVTIRLSTADRGGFGERFTLTLSAR